MTTLMERLIAEQKIVSGFPVTEYWLDIGQHAQYEQAQQDIQSLLEGGSR